MLIQTSLAPEPQACAEDYTCCIWLSSRLFPWHIPSEDACRETFQPRLFITRFHSIRIPCIIHDEVDRHLLRLQVAHVDNPDAVDATGVCLTQLLTEFREWSWCSPSGRSKDHHSCRCDNTSPVHPCACALQLYPCDGYSPSCCRRRAGLRHQAR